MIFNSKKCLDQKVITARGLHGRGINRVYYNIGPPYIIYIYYCIYMLQGSTKKAFDRVPREVVRWALRKMGVDERLISTVMALYTEACTVVRTDAGLSESFEVKVGLHQGSVLSPLLFAAVMDVVSREARSGLPSEFLYADDLVRKAPTMEHLGRCVTEWRASLLDKGLNVNAGKSKVMVGSSGGKTIVNPGKWSCGACGREVQANSVQCTVCKKNGFTSSAVVCVVTCRG